MWAEKLALPAPDYIIRSNKVRYKMKLTDLLHAVLKTLPGQEVPSSKNTTSSCLQSVTGCLSQTNQISHARALHDFSLQLHTIFVCIEARGQLSYTGRVSNRDWI